jgi:hypothetical protein
MATGRAAKDDREAVRFNDLNKFAKAAFSGGTRYWESKSGFVGALIEEHCPEGDFKCPHSPDVKRRSTPQELGAGRLRLFHRGSNVCFDRLLELLGHFLKRAALHGQVKIKGKCLPLILSAVSDAVDVPAHFRTHATLITPVNRFCHRGLPRHRRSDPVHFLARPVQAQFPIEQATDSSRIDAILAGIGNLP